MRQPSQISLKVELHTDGDCAQRVVFGKEGKERLKKIFFLLSLVVVLSGCRTESPEGAWRARKEIAFFDEPQLTENFYFDDQTIHFFYNQYEIACYADGIIEAVVRRSPPIGRGP